ncbi:MAG: hypothetical protein AAFU64_14975, partial [Bacteroidota bacterium]
MRLNGISIEGGVSVPQSNSAISPPAQTYSFDYFSTPLPNRHSLAQDHMGYYNGVRNSGLVPSITIDGEDLSGADREPNPIYANACLLKQITYPTGGYKVFNYESVSFEASSTNEVRVEEQTALFDRSRFTVDPQFADELDDFLDEYCSQLTGSDLYQPVMEVFTFTRRPEDGNAEITFEIKGEQDSEQGECFQSEIYLCKVSDEFWEPGQTTNGLIRNPYDDGVFVGLRDRNNPNYGNVVDYHGLRTEKTTYWAGTNQSSYGTYQVLLIMNNYIDSKLSFKYSFNKFVTNTEITHLPGLRIKSIEAFDHDNALINRKEFKYGAPIKIQEHDYENTSTVYYRDQGCPDPVNWDPNGGGSGNSNGGGNVEVYFCQTINRSASDQSGLGALGYHIGYRQVIEEYQDFNQANQASNGFTVYNFHQNQGSRSGYPSTAPRFLEVQNN